METPTPTPLETTIAAAPSRPQSMEELLGISRAPKAIQFLLGAQKVELHVRALTENEWAPIRKIGADLRPPPKFKDRNRTQPDGEDENDPAYKAQVYASFELRRAAVISVGLVGLTVPGDTLEAKRDWLHEHFPPQLLDVIHNGIRGLTSEPVELASFSTGTD